MNRRAASGKADIGKQLLDEFKAAIPSNEVVVRRGLDKALAPFHGNTRRIKMNVSRLLTEAEKHAYQIYLNAQRPAMARAIRVVFGKQVSRKGKPLDGIRLIASRADALDKFFLSVSQGRRARAGAAVESYFETMFRRLRYPFERHHVIDGTPDFVFPSVKRFRQIATDCVIFTCKRTLRERWRQITSEGSRGFMLFLGTYDGSVKRGDLTEMRRQKIVLVVPEHIRAAAYSKVANVISVETYLLDYLDPAMRRWRRNGVIR